MGWFSKNTTRSGSRQRKRAGNRDRDASNGKLREKLLAHLYKRGAAERIQEPTETTHFKAFKHGRKGYQALETSQVPPPLFPATLASFVLVFQTDDAWNNHGVKEGDGEATVSYAKLNMQPLLDKLRSADMIVREEKFGSEANEAFALVSISEKRQKQVAEIMGEAGLLRLRVRAEDDEEDEIKEGGQWYPFKQHLAHLYQRSSEGTLFSSCQQCQIMEFMLNEKSEKAMGPQLVQKEACEPGNDPLEQLVKDERILTYFYLHHSHKKEWLEKHWVDSWTNKQPMEDIREYFGEDLALYFVWLGYLLTSLWVPAIVGLMVFIVQLVAQAESGSIDNPFNPLYAIFMAVWSIMMTAGWNRLELTYQYVWGTVDFEESSEDRREFVQNTRTYKRLNRISNTEEYYPDPLWRYIMVVAGFLVVCAFIAGNIILILLIEAGKSGMQDLLGLDHSNSFLLKLVGSNVQGIVILVTRWAADMVFSKITDWENWKTQEQYENAIITKRFSFGFISSYFAIYFTASMANHIQVLGVDVSCPDHNCIDYAQLMVAVIFIQNILVRYTMTTLYPMYQRWQAARAAAASGDEEEEEEVPELQRAVTEQHKLPEFEGTINEFSDKMLEIGYVMLFGAAFPLLALLALIYNILDLRAHARIVLSNFRRPAYRCGKDIGTWKTIMDIFAIMSIMSQCAYLGFTSRALYYYFPNMNSLDNVFFAVAAEHLLLLLKVFMDDQEAPDSVIEADEKRQFELETLVDEYDNFKPETDVVFYTSDDGNVHVLGPGKEKSKEK